MKLAILVKLLLVGLEIV